MTSALREDGATIATLVRRDLALFVLQRSRLVGAIVQPLLLWLAVGAGIAPAFRCESRNIRRYRRRVRPVKATPAPPQSRQTPEIPQLFLP